MERARNCWGVCVCACDFCLAMYTHREKSAPQREQICRPRSVYHTVTGTYSRGSSPYSQSHGPDEIRRKRSQKKNSSETKISDDFQLWRPPSFRKTLRTQATITEWGAPLFFLNTTPHFRRLRHVLLNPPQKNCFWEKKINLLFIADEKSHDLA